MDWLKRLKDIKNERKETYKSISDKTGIPLTTIEKLFSGRTADPKLLMITKIMDCLNHDVSELVLSCRNRIVLSDEEQRFISNLRRLDKTGKKRVSDTVCSEIARVEAENAVTQNLTYPVLYYDFPVSAGTGEYLDHRTARIIKLKNEPPSGTDYVLRVSGNSMEPDFSDGDLVFVKSEQRIDYGDIGIFIACGNVYMKMYDKKGLISLNPEYKLIPGSADIKCLGRVLGRM